MSTLALLHLYFLQRAQGTTETVVLNNDCPRCIEIKEALA